MVLVVAGAPDETPNNKLSQTPQNIAQNHQFRNQNYLPYCLKSPPPNLYSYLIKILFLSICIIL